MGCFASFGARIKLWRSVADVVLSMADCLVQATVMDDANNDDDDDGDDGRR